MELKKEYQGHTLVFCSGIDEIVSLCSKYKKIFKGKNLEVLPLHGKLSPEEQKLVFKPSPFYKLIFASRIAETSITIDGIKVVVDPG